MFEFVILMHCWGFIVKEQLNEAKEIGMTKRGVTSRIKINGFIRIR